MSKRQIFGATITFGWLALGVIFASTGDAVMGLLCVLNATVYEWLTIT
jgi:hypothetical protein